MLGWSPGKGPFHSQQARQRLLEKLVLPSQRRSSEVIYLGRLKLHPPCLREAHRPLAYQSHGSEPTLGSRGTSTRISPTPTHLVPSQLTPCYRAGESCLLFYLTSQQHHTPAFLGSRHTSINGLTACQKYSEKMFPSKN